MIWNEDWLALDNKEGSFEGATAKDFIATAYYANSISLLAKAANILQNTEDAAWYSDLYESIIHYNLVRLNRILKRR